MTITHPIRVSSCVLCLRDGQILLARWANPDDPGDYQWSLPGGGVEPAEDPYDAAVREAEEETGYIVELDELLGVHTRVKAAPPGEGGEKAQYHSLRIFYAAHIVGGGLRDEVGGSTDKAAWFDLAQVAELPRDPRVDIGIELAEVRPPTGRLNRTSA